MNLDELERLARTANDACDAAWNLATTDRGEWLGDKGSGVRMEREYALEALAAALSPDVALALVARVRELEAVARGHVEFVCQVVEALGGRDGAWDARGLAAVVREERNRALVRCSELEGDVARLREEVDEWKNNALERSLR